MELKVYQHKVIKDLERFLNYLQKYKKTDEAFNKYWEDNIGQYEPLAGKGMQPYKNTIPNAVHVCIKVPTAGGKTFIACNALRTIFNAYYSGDPKTVVWLVPWSNLLDQTVANLKNPDHPYRRRLDALFNHRVEVYEKKDLLQGSNFNPTVVKEQLSIIVMSFASLRTKNKEDRKVYQENSQLANFVTQYKTKDHLLNSADDTSLINVIRSFNPVLVVDESHNAESDLSVDMLNALNPSFVLDLTATPKDNSNIITLVPAIELKKEHMVKLPVIVYNHHDKTEVINNALHLQHKLESLAVEEEKNGGRYIRPIVLFQAQPKKGEETTTFDRLKTQLLALGIPAQRIKIKTANKDELKGINLSARDCEVRYIITINALKEGWDCPFAYVLASLADRSSTVDVEQILGRVLRQPYVMKHEASLLNNSYVLTASAKFSDTLQRIVEGLQASGFSERDYRQKEGTTITTIAAGDQPTLPTDNPAKDIDAGRISFPFNNAEAKDTVFVEEIRAMAEISNREMEETITRQEAMPEDENIYSEMGDKVKRYLIAEAYRAKAAEIKLPQFYLETKQNDIFGDSEIKLNQESLLRDFKLSHEDSKIDFEQVRSDLYQVDIEETRKEDYAVRFTKIEDQLVKDPVIDYILARPFDKQVKDIAHQVVQLVGDMYPISDAEIRIYIERILAGMTPEQVKDFLVRKWSYADRIKTKIRQHTDAYAEIKFNDLVKLGKIYVRPAWSFHEQIVPGNTGAAIGHSLYEKEGIMNSLETAVINTIAGLPTILFWHRNLGRGKGFAINGFKSNHYPDFIIVTKNGNVILIETKGDDRDNSDSAAKCRLGLRWEQLSGRGYNYFMIFDKKQIDGAHTLEKATELIKQL